MSSSSDEEEQHQDCDQDGGDAFYHGSAGRCGACRYIRRACVANCVFAPYFAPGDTERFKALSQVYGGSNVSKLLAALRSGDDGAALVDSLVLEARARQRDPVLGISAHVSLLVNMLKAVKGQVAVVREDMARRGARGFAFQPFDARSAPPWAKAFGDQKLAESVVYAEWEGQRIRAKVAEEAAASQRTQHLALQPGGMGRGVPNGHVPGPSRLETVQRTAGPPESAATAREQALIMQQALMTRQAAAQAAREKELMMQHAALQAARERALMMRQAVAQAAREKELMMQHAELQAAKARALLTRQAATQAARQKELMTQRGQHAPVQLGGVRRDVPHGHVQGPPRQQMVQPMAGVPDWAAAEQAAREYALMLQQRGHPVAPHGTGLTIPAGHVHRQQMLLGAQNSAAAGQVDSEQVQRRNQQTSLQVQAEAKRQADAAAQDSSGQQDLMMRAAVAAGVTTEQYLYMLAWEKQQQQHYAGMGMTGNQQDVAGQQMPQQQAAAYTNAMHGNGFGATNMPFVNGGSDAFLLQPQLQLPPQTVNVQFQQEQSPAASWLPGLPTTRQPSFLSLLLDGSAEVDPSYVQQQQPPPQTVNAFGSQSLAQWTTDLPPQHQQQQQQQQQTVSALGSQVLPPPPSAGLPPPQQQSDDGDEDSAE